MAIVSQPVPGALGEPRYARTARALPSLDAGVALSPRWLTPAYLASADALALVVALLTVGSHATVVLVYPVAALVCLAASGAFRNRMSLRALDALPWLVTRLTVPLVALAPIAVLTGSDTGALLLVAFVSAGYLAPERVLAYAALRRARRHGFLLDSAVILGAGEVGAELGRAFRDHRDYGVAPAGFLDSVSGDLPYAVLGDVDRLSPILAEYEVRRVIVAFGPARESELVDVLRTAVMHDVDVHIVPRFFDCGVAPEGPDTDDVRGIPLYRVRRAALRAPAWYLKRIVDVVIAGTVLVVTAPVIAVGALGVRVSSAGPVFFRQRRVGQGGREIEVHKLRTLRVNHDSETQWSADDDPRVTVIGAFLRRTSIDELPQLWNVIKGDMSLVGPRPERPFFVRRFAADIDGYSARHRLPVGLTGWAQVHGLRGNTSIAERARFDNQYIEHWSLWRDLVILVRTVAEVLRSALQRS